jgi:hypothetical protein
LQHFRQNQNAEGVTKLAAAIRCSEYVIAFGNRQDVERTRAGVDAVAKQSPDSLDAILSQAYTAPFGGAPPSELIEARWWCVGGESLFG